MKGIRDPQTPEEWQEAVNVADFTLAIDNARMYGLIETNARPDYERCEDILKKGREMGITPNYSIE